MFDFEVLRDQADQFVRSVLTHAGCASLGDLPAYGSTAIPIQPVVLPSIDSITPKQREDLRVAYRSLFGVAYFIIERPPEIEPEHRHPLLQLCDILRDDLPLKYPLTHPLEQHDRLLTEFGRKNGTVKVYDVKKSPESGYREQGETSDAFLLHHDGLGSAGTVEVAVLYTESAPVWGGFTYFFDVPRLALELARLDAEAFVALFAPDVLTITRPRGKGAIRVRTPALYVNECGEAQSAYRVASGEYVVEWGARSEVGRARVFLEDALKPFGRGCFFLNFSAAGQGCFIRNAQIAHGRTNFMDGVDQRRVLARKWFMRSSPDAIYKHVPAVKVNQPFASKYPEFFGESLLVGEWIFEESTHQNRQVK